jgi:predicted MFS family arabinose efflux permease
MSSAVVRWLTGLDRDFILIYLSILLWGFGLFLYIYIQPLYITQLGATPEQVGLALGLGSLFVTVLYAPIGLWADRRGRKTVILAGWTLGTVAGFGFALAPDWRWFIPAMAVYTLSNFAVSVLNGYIVAKAPSAEARGQIFALLSSGSAIGSILAPAVGGWVGEQYGLRAVYLTAACFYVLSTVAIALIRPQPAEPQATGANARGLLRERSVIWSLLLVFGIFFAVEVGQVLAPKFLQEVRGLSIHQIGWLGTASAVGVMVLSLALSRLRGEGRHALILSQVAAWVGVALLMWTASWPGLLIAFFIAGSNRLVRPPALVQFSRLLTPATMSFGMGLQQTASQIGLALAPYVAGLLYARNPSWPFIAGLVAIGLTCALSIIWPATSQPRGPLALQTAKEG